MKLRASERVGGDQRTVWGLEAASGVLVTFAALTEREAEERNEWGAGYRELGQVWRKAGRGGSPVPVA